MTNDDSLRSDEGKDDDYEEDYEEDYEDGYEDGYEDDDGDHYDDSDIGSEFVDEPIKKQRTQRQKKCKKFGKFLADALFSLVGLTGMVAGYAIGGAFLFEQIESDNEIAVKHVVLNNKKRTMERLWNVTSNLQLQSNVNEWKQQVTEELVQFEKLLSVSYGQGWDGNKELNVATRWAFSSSFLFSVNVITTIGYGNLVPLTKEGMYATILYAIPGIPLCLVWLSTCGGVMATAFRFVYRKIGYLIRGRLLSFYQPRKHRHEPVRVPMIVTIVVIIGYILVGAGQFSAMEDWEYHESAYFCFITLATIGFGDFVPGEMKAGGFLAGENKDLRFISGAFYLIIGLIILSMCFELLKDEVTAKFKTFIRFCCCHKQRGIDVSQNNRADKAPPDHGDRVQALKAEAQPCGLSLSPLTYSSVSMRALPPSSGDGESVALAKRIRRYSILSLTNARYGTEMPDQMGQGEES